MNAPPIDPHAILTFWFGDGYAQRDIAPRAAWFAKDATFDAEIGQRFGAQVAALLDRPDAACPIAAPRDAPWDVLAQLIALDQFPRNLYRGDPRAFAGDAAALALARRLVDSGADRLLPGMARTFAYLPFEHSEALAEQDRSLALFEQLAGEGDFSGALDYARRHHAIITRFGRFPHRNAILGRESTPEEIAFLRQPGSRF
jgi:uncharacterized protein (DUF924 family)